jgi:hypothetical protein
VTTTRADRLAAALADPHGDRATQVAALQMLAALAEREKLPNARDAFDRYADQLSRTLHGESV